MQPNATPPKNAPLDKNIATNEIGSSGTLISKGRINGEEYNKVLTGTSGYRIYDIMRRSDSTERQALQVVKLPIQSASNSIIPARDADGVIVDAAQTHADFIEDQLFHKIDFDQFKKELLTQLDFGFSLFENVYKPDTFNGSAIIGLDKIAYRKQTTIISWETIEGEEGVTQRANGFDAVSIPRNKMTIFTHDKEGGNLEGVSILRYSYRDWDIKDKLILVNAISLEKQGMGIPVVTARENMSPSAEDESAAEQVLSNLRANEAAYIKVPGTMMVEMMDMKGQTTKDIEPFINYLDGRIMASVLARFMELGGASGTGSQSLSADLSSFFMKSEETLAKNIAAVINRDIIRPLIDLNFTDAAKIGYPELKFSDLGDDDMTALATNLAGLTNAGLVTADVDIEEDLRVRYNLPEMSEETRKAWETKDEVALPDQTAKDTLDAARTKFFETNDEAAALQAAREFRDQLIDQLNGV